MIQHEGKQTIFENLSGSKNPSKESFGFISSMGISGTDWLEVPTIYPYMVGLYNFHLVGGLEHSNYFSIYWECHHPNWRTHIFQMGRSTTHQPGWFGESCNFQSHVLSLAARSLNSDWKRLVQRAHVNRGVAGMDWISDGLGQVNCKSDVIIWFILSYIYILSMFYFHLLFA